jgi:hypothetical protein
MSVWRTLGIPLLLCATSITGIVAMLVFQGAADIAGFVLAALPLIVGLAALARRSRQQR